ncbi:suppressor of fused domain protein [Roseateles sp. DAIF2]|uniref:suppressor of fused domain protein n=1 Tax=Roseateles sp. DAIF2 TaxID=2714952 RepID=UPI0018A297F8|nr:suppressor of fused domain protein [Roseateles sp. DAIF2]QPF71544.1 suppressor of fused domain protein [Roseateles sp. DAIF2]
MASDDPKRSAELVSLSGSPIYRHGNPKPWAAPQGEEFIQQISAHIERHLGPIETVFHEIASDLVHIDVHVVKPSPAFPYVRFITSGMSDLPMTVPEGAEVPRYAELMMTLPADWKTDQASFEDESWYWPIRLIKGLARLPHKHATWLGFGHTVPNGDPAEPYAPNTALCGALVLPPVSVPPAFRSLDIPGVKTVSFYAVVPLHAKEMEFKLRAGVNRLLERFDRKGVDDRVDPQRADATLKRFGLW